MKYQVIYCSETGNTEKLAKHIFETLPGTDKDIQRFEPGMELAPADFYFIGFWVNRGTCSMDLLDLISRIHDGRLVLFGTCGMGSNEEYYKNIEEGIEAWVADDCEFTGTFLCQGKMPIQVRKRYESMLNKGQDEKIEKMIRNFDRAMTHPDQEDLNHLSQFVKNVVETLDQS